MGKSESMFLVRDAEYFKESLKLFCCTAEKSLLAGERSVFTEIFYTVCSQNVDQVLRFQHAFETERLTGKRKISCNDTLCNPDCNPALGSNFSPSTD